MTDPGSICRRFWRRHLALEPEEAWTFGVYCSFKFLQDTWLTIKRIAFNDISPKSMGGIITIGAVSYSMAEAGWAKLFFFLCLDRVGRPGDDRFRHGVRFLFVAVVGLVDGHAAAAPTGRAGALLHDVCQFMRQKFLTGA